MNFTDKNGVLTITVQAATVHIKDYRNTNNNNNISMISNNDKTTVTTTVKQEQH